MTFLEKSGYREHVTLIKCGKYGMQLGKFTYPFIMKGSETASKHMKTLSSKRVLQNMNFMKQLIFIDIFIQDLHFEGLFQLNKVVPWK